jgi:hypothetical protein
MGLIHANFDHLSGTCRLFFGSHFPSTVRLNDFASRFKIQFDCLADINYLPLCKLEFSSLKMHIVFAHLISSFPIAVYSYLYVRLPYLSHLP